MELPNKDFIHFTLEYLDSVHLTETKNILERESKAFFNLSYVSDAILSGDWDSLLAYISAFIKPTQNEYSTKIFHLIKMEKHRDALLRFDKECFTSIFTDKNIKLHVESESRKEDLVKTYGDTTQRRSYLKNHLIDMLRVNPTLKNALEFYEFDGCTVQSLVHQRLSKKDDAQNNRALYLSKPAPNLPTAATLPGVGEMATKIVRFVYTHFGNAVLVLQSDALIRSWKWVDPEQNPPQGTVMVVGSPMINDVKVVDLGTSIPCLALNKDDTLLISATGGSVSIFNLETSTIVGTVLPPPSPTFLAFDPLNSDMIAIGMCDCTIHIYSMNLAKVVDILKSHTDYISGLAYSGEHKILVSCAPDSKIISWSSVTWKKMKCKSFPLSSGNGELHVEFDINETRLLAFHGGKIATFRMPSFKTLHEREVQGKGQAQISFATFNCKCEWVFVGFRDAKIAVYDADTLKPVLWLNPTDYLPREILCSQLSVLFPIVIAAHPRKKEQFAACMTDGSLVLLDASAAVSQLKTSSNDSFPGVGSSFGFVKRIGNK